MGLGRSGVVLNFFLWISVAEMAPWSLKRITMASEAEETSEAIVIEWGKDSEI